MQCTNCKSEILPTAKFCPDCGNKVENKGKACPNKECNRSSLPSEALFCPDCGAKIVSDLQSTFNENTLKNALLIEIGNHLTKIKVINDGFPSRSVSIEVGKDSFLSTIQEYMRHQHNVKISLQIADDILNHVGSAMSHLDIPPKDYTVFGPNQITALPLEISVSFQEIAHCINKELEKILSGILNLLEQIPPDSYVQIFHNGIYLIEKGFHLRGIEIFFARQLGFRINLKSTFSID